MAVATKKWKALIGLVSVTLVRYHFAYRNSSLLFFMSDVLLVLLCSLTSLGLLFRESEHLKHFFFSSLFFSISNFRVFLFSSFLLNYIMMMKLFLLLVNNAVVSLGTVIVEKEAGTMNVVARPRKLRALKRGFSMFRV